MSSWNQSIVIKPSLSLNELYWQASKSGYCTNFQSYLIGYIYAKYKKRKFYIQDKTSNISEYYHLIKDTFELPEYVTVTDKKGTSIFLDKIYDINQYLLRLSNDDIRNAAKECFTLKPSVLEIVNKYSSHLPEIDLGIHIRMGDKITSGEMKVIDLQVYIDAIYSEKSLISKDSLNVYIMTDNSSVIDNLRAKVDTSISFFAIPAPHTIPGGHDQKTFNSLPTDIKKSAFYHFLSELRILQRCPRVLCTYSSNIGRFLYMTCNNPEGIKSLDIQQFTILRDMSIVLENSRHQ